MCSSDLRAPYRRACVAIARDPLTALARYGVRDVLVPPDFAEPTLSGNPTLAGFETDRRWADVQAAILAASTPVAEAGWQRRTLPDPDPLAFSDRALPVSFDAGGATVQLGGSGVTTVNLLVIPGLVAEVDGVAAPIVADAWGRVTVNAVGRTLRVAYRPPWSRGLAIGAMLAGLGILTAFVLRRG